MGYDIILLKCSSAMLSIFMPEMQKGFGISAYEGITVYSFLTDTCRMNEDYISEKVKTLLINGGPVDDIFKTEISEGSTCAVSGAMPGIVGAMMRIGSPYAAMRESITVKPGRTSESGKEILITLKLFNVILSDLGERFLRDGIILEKQRVFELYKRYGDEINSECREILLNDSPVDKNLLNNDESLGISDPVILKIETEDENNG